MEETLVLVLGPPPDEWQKDLFDRYQEWRKTDADGDLPPECDWEAYENKIVEWLFERKNGAPSEMEQLLGMLLQSPIELTDYFPSMGVSRELWVMKIAISRSQVHCGQGGKITWPPSKEIIDGVATVLTYILKREWIGVFSLYP